MIRTVLTSAFLALVPALAMAQTTSPISGLPAASVANLTDLIPCVQLGSPNVTRKCTSQQVVSLGSSLFLSLTGGTLSGPLVANGGISGSQTGSGSLLGPGFSFTRAVPAYPSGSDGNLINLSVSLNWAGGASAVTENAFNVTVNDGGIGGVAPNAFVFGGAVTVDTSTAAPLGTELEGVEVWHSTCIKTEPVGGVPVGSRQRNCEPLWLLSLGPNNQFSSTSGVELLQEGDINSNGVDDGNNRLSTELLYGTQTAVGSGGWPVNFHAGIYMAGQFGRDPQYTWLDDAVFNSTNFAHAALDLTQAASAAPTITSATPGSPVNSVTVDNGMPLGGSDTNFLGSPGFDNTWGHITTASSTITSATIPVASTANLQLNSLAYDITTPANIPSGARILSIGTGTVTLSASASVTSGDTLLFSKGTKRVLLGSNNYSVAGVVLAGAGSPVATVYFTSNVSTSDAANGNKLYPNNHEIWLCPGSATAPWCDIAFDAAGLVTLRSDGQGGVQITGIGGWGSGNWGKQLLLTTVGGVASNPAIGFTDASGANLWGISDNMGALQFAAMPARSDSTTAPTVELSLGADVVLGIQTGLGAAATSGFTHPFAFTSSIPTGVPANTTTPPCVVNTATGNINCYYGAAWHHIAFSAGAG